MEDKIHPNPIRHRLMQGLTLLLLVTEWFRAAVARGVVPNYALAVLKTHCVSQFALVGVFGR